MRRFLYISPSFPPVTSVGALRPLKFARHLPTHGWAPVVLADLHESDGMSRALLDAVPPSTLVRWDYSRHAADAARAFEAGALPRARVDAGGKPLDPPQGLRRWLPRALRNEYRSRSFWFPDQRLLPMGHNLVDLRHATQAGRRALRAHPECEAIVVNAGPEAALLVGRRLALEFGLPLISDLRDPWGLCTLRQQGMPAPQRRWVAWMERRFVDASARFILNSETALADYRAHYADVDPDRFACIRNHGDAALIAQGSAPPRAPFSILFLGNFRKFVEGDVLLEALGRLREAGYGADRVRFVITGRILGSARDLAARLGITEMVESAPFVPYTEIGPFMASMDLLVALSNDSRQRIPAKVYDYLTTARPIVVIADNPELRDMLAPIPGTAVCGLTDVAAVTEAFRRAIDAGRQQTVHRDTSAFDSAVAARALAHHLDAVTAAV